MNVSLLICPKPCTVISNTPIVTALEVKNPLIMKHKFFIKTSSKFQKVFFLVFCEQKVQMLLFFTCFLLLFFLKTWKKDKILKV